MISYAKHYAPFLNELGLAGLGTAISNGENGNRAKERRINEYLTIVGIEEARRLKKVKGRAIKVLYYKKAVCISSFQHGVVVCLSSDVAFHDCVVAVVVVQRSKCKW